VEDEAYGVTADGWRALDGDEFGDGCLCVELVPRSALAQVRRLLQRLRG
jgi:hypothetical protein